MNILIETERLILRELLPTDAEGMYLLDSNPNVHQYLGNKPVASIEESNKYIENIRNQYVINGIGRYAVILKETNEFMGWAGIKYVTETENNQVNFYDIGYRLIEDFWGKGYGYEAAKAWLDYGFNEMNIQKMVGTVNKDNIASRKILEKIGLKITSEYYWNEIPCYWLELENNK
ncbi:GNAT family N-acetyltransferase [Flavobacterium sp. K5-23]|uniref:GNAT family N-acetyltransferase n=1 Tax=Flavobacterium sp. K5-23 TaxID=2746225 RepID=UPI00200F42E2|nr:GNAT family N-acetyltransferase [Flavobacterium sp. K5-23]UQD57044.1 GNAT family N-acetyltransferase [Flavobacterium sp. K5-23]